MPALITTRNPNTLFVGNCERDETPASLYAHYRVYGNLMEVKIKSKRTGSFAFVTFLKHEDAIDAYLEETQNRQKRHTIRWAEYRSPVPVQSGTVNSLYVRFASWQPSLVITRAFLMDVLGAYGPVVEASIKESIVSERGHHSGYGFVTFAPNPEGLSAAFKASARLDGKYCGSIFFQVELGRNIQMRLAGVCT